jgi:EF hand
MFSRVVCSLAAVLALAGSARADLAGSPGGRAALARFNTLDRDHDGGVSRAELQALGPRRAADALFALLDARGDGRIRVADMGRLYGGAVRARFSAYDARHSGVVTRLYFPNFLDPALFAALDRNHDGRLSLDEVRPAFVGSRAQAVVTPSAPARHRVAAAALPLCWVPVINKDGPWLQMPVMAGGLCRTQ